MMTKTTIRIDEELLRKAQHRCIDEDLTFQQLVERALLDYLKKSLQKDGRGARK